MRFAWPGTSLTTQSMDSLVSKTPSQVMDVLPSLIMKAKLDTGNAHPNPILIKIKELCDKSLAVAHQYSIVRTQVETAVAEEEEEVGIEPWQRAPDPWALD